PLLLIMQPDTPQDQLRLSMFFVLVLVPLTCLGIALILCTMRAANGYRGLHEFASGTRVIRLPTPLRHLSIRAQRLDQALKKPEGLPQRVGTYDIRGALRWGPQSKLLLGDDSGLQRQVVVRLKPDNESPLEQGRQEVTRATRLRWLGSGHSDF